MNNNINAVCDRSFPSLFIGQMIPVADEGRGGDLDSDHGCSPSVTLGSWVILPVEGPASVEQGQRLRGKGDGHGEPSTASDTPCLLLGWHYFSYSGFACGSQAPYLTCLGLEKIGEREDAEKTFHPSAPSICKCGDCFPQPHAHSGGSGRRLSLYCSLLLLHKEFRKLFGNPEP